MNINSIAFNNCQTTNYNNRSNVNFGRLRGIELRDEFKNLDNEDILDFHENFKNAKWKDELGEDYEYKVRLFGGSDIGYCMFLIPYHDEKSEQDPLPHKIRFAESSLKELNKTVKESTVKDIYKRIYPIDVKARRKENVLAYIDKVNNG